MSMIAATRASGVRDSALSSRTALREALRAQAWLPERLFDFANDTLFFVKNHDARYVAVNQAMVTRCGVRSKQDLLGCTALDLFPQPFASAYYAQDRRVLDLGAEINATLQQVPHSDGAAGWSLSYKFPLPDRDGRIVGLCGICKDIREPDALHLPQLALALEHIRDHYADPLRIDSLARIAGLGARRLERLTRRLFASTPKQLLARARIEAASRLLREGDASIATIASACGYSDQSAFARQFKQIVGKTPTRYRVLTLARGAVLNDAVE
jgi:PAS domain S-box-containing protein